MTASAPDGPARTAGPSRQRRGFRRFPGWLVLAVLTALSACSDRSRLPQGLEVHGGPVTGAVVERDGHRIAFYGNPGGESGGIEKVFLTHHRRDVAWAARELAERGARVVAPAAELPLISGAQGFWDEFRATRFHDYAQQSTRVLVRNLPVDEPARGGRTIHWRGLEIEVLDTPGYTRGAVSYLVRIGSSRVAFTGDLVLAGGRILDLYSLQDSIEETETRGYHGYAARAADLMASLRAVRAAEPDLIVPARGPVILDPEHDINLLLGRMEQLFLAYFRTDALRWYWGEDNLRKRARRILGDAPLEWMPMAVQLRQTPPRWWYKFGTSRLLVSSTKAAFLIDCGSEDVLRQVRRLKRRGVFRKLEGIFVTHFHDDHTDYVQAMATEENVPVYAGKELQDILENPQAYRMPAMTYEPIHSVRPLTEGQRLRWHEFEFEYTYFPGQAIYHGGLDVRHDNGDRYFFVGDSFSPSGVDDYCLLNRHLLHPGTGHARCLDRIESMEGDYWLVNQHIEEVFRYDREQLATMREVLAEKRHVIAEIVPWEDPNFGIDEQWARLYPYGQEVLGRESFDIYGIILNHLPEARTFLFRPNLPEGWTCQPESSTLRVGPLQENRVRFEVRPPEGFRGPQVITADVAFGDHDLREWVEAMVDVLP